MPSDYRLSIFLSSSRFFSRLKVAWHSERRVIPIVFHITSLSLLTSPSRLFQTHETDVGQPRVRRIPLVPLTSFSITFPFPSFTFSHIFFIFSSGLFLILGFVIQTMSLKGLERCQRPNKWMIERFLLVREGKSLRVKISRVFGSGRRKEEIQVTFPKVKWEREVI